MRTFWKIFLLLVVGGIGFVTYSLWSYSYQLNYKVSIDMDDNGTPRHGEGVIEVHFYSNPILIDNTPTWTMGARGEAFAVDLGARGTMFVLLCGDPLRNPHGGPADPDRAALWVYFNKGFGEPATWAGLRQIQAFASRRDIVELSPNRLPMLVQFRDVNDPKSVERIDPLHLDESFSPGLKFTRVTAQLTDEPMTIGIVKKLPWLAKGGYETFIFPPHGEKVTDIPVTHLIKFGNFRTNSLFEGQN